MVRGRRRPITPVLEPTKGEGASRGCECVGDQAHDPHGHEHPNMTLNTSSTPCASPAASASWIVSHELPLTGPEGYQHSDSRDNGWTKVVLAPGKSNGRTVAA
jgi:hypothetical protein